MQTTRAEQRQILEAVVGWAAKIHEHLGDLQQREGHRVHFRPGSRSISMVGLLPERPQRGKSNIRNLARLADNFEVEFATHCRDIEHGRPTPEKRLQSFLVSDAYQHGRRMNVIEQACSAAGHEVELVFITDEILVRPLNADGTGKIVCDILALRRLPDGKELPVVMELKSNRAMTERIRQTTTYAALMLEHQDVFERLYGALLGREVSFAGPPEKWVVWPAPPGSRRQDGGLSEQQITVVEYTEADRVYDLQLRPS